MDEQLIAAIESRNLQQINELLAAGANPNAKKNDRTAYQLIPHGADEIKCALIEAGANDPSLRHSLVWAINTGRVETIRVLIEKGADVNMASVGLGSPLQSAARQGNVEIVDLLIAAGADVDDGNSISTPLLTAIEKGYREIALKLIAAGANPTQTSRFGSVPPIAMAAAQGSAEVIQALIAAGADVNVDVRHITINRAAIQKQAGAALKSAFEMLETAGKAFQMLDAVETKDAPLSEVNETIESFDIAANRTKLSNSSIAEPENAVDTFSVILAARCGHAEALAVLLEAGAEPYRKDGEGLSAYDWAVRNEDSQVLEVLRRFGVNAPRVSSDEHLLNAAEQGDVAAVHEWLAQGANVNARDERRKTKNSTPLMLAVASGHLEVVQALLQKGANPNLSDAGDESANIPQMLIENTDSETIASMGYCLGRTPLILAAQSGNLEIVQAVIAARAELNTQDALGYTALHQACEHRNIDVVRELINAGADTTTKNLYEETVLIRPAQKCDLDLIRLLLEQNINVNAISTSGQTALALTAGATEWVTVKDSDPQQGERQYRDDGIWECRPMLEEKILQAIEILITAGADLNLANCSMTPLGQAASCGYLRVMQYLLDAGARVDLCTNDGDTALDMADLYGKPEALEFLQQRALDINWKSRWGRNDDEDEESEENYDDDERWGPELARPDFSQAAQNPEYQKAVADLGEICGSQPVPIYEEIPGWFQVHVNGKRRREIKTEELQQQFLQRGCFVYEPDKYYDEEGPKKLNILPTTDKYDIIALHQTNGCNCGIGPGYVVEWLRELEAVQPFILTLVAHDTLEGRFLTRIEDPERLADRMYDFCPDIVDQGCGSVERLAEELNSSDNLFFWWD